MLRGKAHTVRSFKSRTLPEGLFCNYSHRTCMQNRLKDSEYCIKHILEDKNSSFKQCGFVSGKNGKRCPNAAPKSDRKEGYCPDHSKKNAVLRQRALRKRKPRETSESLLEELAQYHGPAAITEPIVPENRKSRLPSDSLANKVLDYASSSDSESETPLVDQAWRGDGDSDAESIDSEQEDPLKHAGVFTAEEATLILRDKLIRLQSLYIDQFKRLQHILKEKRRKYLHSYKQEKETLGSIKLYKNDPEQREKYQKLKALKRYHKRYGREALLHRSCKQRRIAVSEGQHYKPPSYPKCIFTEDGVKCNARTIPLSKYCVDHILNDPSQVLFQPCSFANKKCGRPVATYLDEPVCQLHCQLEEMTSRILTEPVQDQEPVLPPKEESVDVPVNTSHSQSLMSMLQKIEPSPSHEPQEADKGEQHDVDHQKAEKMDTS